MTLVPLSYNLRSLWARKSATLLTTCSIGATVAVLTAIVVPGMLRPEGEWALDWHNAYLLAGLLSILVAALTRNLLATIAGGLLSFFVMRWAFGQLPL